MFTVLCTTLTSLSTCTVSVISLMSHTCNILLLNSYFERVVDVFKEVIYFTIYDFS